MSNYWGKSKVTREEVIAFLREHDYDQNLLQLELESFGGKTGEDFAYECGWGAVMAILKRAFE